MTPNIEKHAEKCTFCGNDLPERTTSKGPRPMQHKECQTTENDFARLMRAIDAQPAMTKERRQQFFENMFALSNEVRKKK